jgi:hypothetical protein
MYPTIRMAMNANAVGTNNSTECHMSRSPPVICPPWLAAVLSGTS